MLDRTSPNSGKENLCAVSEKEIMIDLPEKRLLFVTSQRYQCHQAGNLVEVPVHEDWLVKGQAVYTFCSFVTVHSIMSAFVS